MAQVLLDPGTPDRLVPAGQLSKQLCGVDIEIRIMECVRQLAIGIIDLHIVDWILIEAFGVLNGCIGLLRLNGKSIG